MHALIALHCADQNGGGHDGHVGSAGFEQARHGHRVHFQNEPALFAQRSNQLLVNRAVVETAHQRHLQLGVVLQVTHGFDGGAIGLDGQQRGPVVDQRNKGAQCVALGRLARWYQQIGTAGLKHDLLPGARHFGQDKRTAFFVRQAAQQIGIDAGDGVTFDPHALTDG